MGYLAISKLLEHSFLEDNKLLTLLLGITVLVCTRYFLRKKNNARLPPGPSGLPLLGYYPFVMKDPIKSLCELGKKYGNVFGLYLGPQYTVVFNDWEALKDGLGQSASLDRPPKLFAGVPYKFGIGGSNGAEWVETRRLAARVMKDIGLHSSRLEELVEEEVHEMVDDIIKEGERPVAVREFLCESFANNIVTLILGERLKHGNPITMTVTHAVDTILEHTPTVGMMNFSPTLSKILQLLGLEKPYLLGDKIKHFAQFVSKTTDEKIQNSEKKNEDESFIYLYHQEIEMEKKKNVASYITEDSLKGAVTVLLAGGSETGRTVIVWSLVAMANHPDKQQKVHEELDSVIGRDGFIRWSDRFKIPYTYATLMEAMRWSAPLPFSTLRIASEDMQVQGYFIPKGTFLFANIWAIHNDPRYWEKPDQFIPERFLLDDGKKVNTNPDSFCPFSYGKRICPGKLIAYMEMLQYFTIMMQKFKVLPKEGHEKVKYTRNLGLSYQAIGVELRFIRR